MSYKEEFIELMLESDVLKFGDFITKSGRKTPYFINTGNYKSSRAIAKLGSFYAESFTHIKNITKPLLFGPAYKGIPLVTATAVSLYKDKGIDVDFCFNRKEAKDHGEKGIFIGKTPESGDEIVIIEDVITAGTALRETASIMKNIDGVKIKALIVAVDRMERGSKNKSAISEIKEEFGIETYPILNIREISEYLHNRKIKDKVYVDDSLYEKIMEHLEKYKEI